MSNSTLTTFRLMPTHLLLAYGPVSSARTAVGLVQPPARIHNGIARTSSRILAVPLPVDTAPTQKPKCYQSVIELTEVPKTLQNRASGSLEIPKTVQNKAFGSITCAGGG
eukprot:5214511-Amphidinium_carterae.1